jgi:hypothetical protein
MQVVRHDMTIRPSEWLKSQLIKGQLPVVWMQKLA